MTHATQIRRKQIRDALRALHFTTTGTMPHNPSRRECTYSRDPRHAPAFVTDDRDPRVRRPNLLAGIWHTGRVDPAQWLRPLVTEENAAPRTAERQAA